MAASATETSPCPCRPPPPEEYVKVFQDYKLTYKEAKQAAFNSIRHSFIKARGTGVVAAAHDCCSAQRVPPMPPAVRRRKAHRAFLLLSCRRPR